MCLKRRWWRLVEKARFPSARHRKGLDLAGTLADNSRRYPSSCGADIPRVSHGIYGAIAQLGERLLCKQEVVGSIPSGSTNFPSKENNGAQLCNIAS